jgi:class 3 adenylate cyclase
MRKDLKKNNPNNKEEEHSAIDFSTKDVFTLSDLLGSGSVMDGGYEFLGSASFDSKLRLEEEINSLKKQLSEAIKEVTDRTEEKQGEINKLKADIKQKEKINHILPRIHESAREKLMQDEKFKEEFKDSRVCNAVVISIDIRRSTELMLKARKPELFSEFVTELTSALSKVVIENLGIFDKFTGDGILAFFPKFYSGESAILRAINAAQKCHEVFTEHYNNCRKNFNVFIKDVGLGIGMDYGEVSLVNSRNELTVVGIPVVYACRMSSANAGETILNQPAHEELESQSVSDLKIVETEINIKNEGRALAYKVEKLREFKNLQKPIWYEESSNTP